MIGENIDDPLEQGNGAARAHRPCHRLSPTDQIMNEKNLEQGLVFVGLVGMLNAPSKEVSEAVAKCRGARIRVVIVDRGP